LNQAKLENDLRIESLSNRRSKFIVISSSIALSLALFFLFIRVNSTRQANTVSTLNLTKDGEESALSKRSKLGLKVERLKSKWLRKVNAGLLQEKLSELDEEWAALGTNKERVRRSIVKQLVGFLRRLRLVEVWRSEVERGQRDPNLY